MPIIFLTAYYSEDQHVLEGYSTGAVDYLHKPINPAILRRRWPCSPSYTARAARSPGPIATCRRSERATVAEEQLRQLNDELEHRVAERTESRS